jgi:hypothetical protein
MDFEFVVRALFHSGKAGRRFSWWKIISMAAMSMLCSILAGCLESQWMWDTHKGLDHIMIWQLIDPLESANVLANLIVAAFITLLLLLIATAISTFSRWPVFLICLVAWTCLFVQINSWKTKGNSIATASTPGP